MPAVFLTLVRIVCICSFGVRRGGEEDDLLADSGAEDGAEGGGGESGVFELIRGTLTEVLRRCRCDGGVTMLDSSLRLRLLLALNRSADAVMRTANSTVKRFAGGTPRTLFQMNTMKRTNAFPGGAIIVMFVTSYQSKRLCDVQCPL